MNKEELFFLIIIIILVDVWGNMLQDHHPCELGSLQEHSIPVPN